MWSNDDSSSLVHIYIHIQASGILLMLDIQWYFIWTKISTEWRQPERLFNSAIMKYENILLLQWSMIDYNKTIFPFRSESSWLWISWTVQFFPSDVNIVLSWHVLKLGDLVVWNWIIITCCCGGVSEVVMMIFISVLSEFPWCCSFQIFYLKIALQWAMPQPVKKDRHFICNTSHQIAWDFILVA